LIFSLVERGNKQKNGQIFCFCEFIGILSEKDIQTLCEGELGYENKR
jgi:hypothetical protein